MAGPPVLFSLNPSAGPTRQSPCFSSFSRNRRPASRARTPLRRRSRAACSPLQAAVAPELFTAPPPALAHTRARYSCAAAPQPFARPSRACATHAPPLTTAVGLSPSASKPSPQYCSTSSPLHEFQARFGVLCTLDSVHKRCSRNCLLGCSSISSLFSKGMAYTLLSM